MFVLRQPVAFVNQELVGFRQDVFIANNIAQFCNERVLFDLLPADHHETGIITAELAG